MGSTDTCFPYTMPTCEHHVPTPAGSSRQNCEKVPQNSPRCKKECTGDKSIKWNSDVHKADTRGYSLRSVDQIK